MKALTFAACIFAMALSGCATQVARRVQNADGLLGFIFGYPGPNIAPVERISRAGGEIVTAHAVADGKGLRVSGLVSKAGLHKPPYGSHIDVFVLDARGKITAAVAADYLPRDIPRRYRGSMGYSLYGARLPIIPAPGSRVQVVFHGTSRARCEINAAGRAPGNDSRNL